VSFFESAGYKVENRNKLEAVAEVLQIRLETLAEAPQKGGFFFKDEIHPEPEMLVGKNMTPDETLSMAREIYRLLQSLPDFSEENANQPLRNLAAELGLKAGQLFGFLRNAITAEKVTPPIFETMTIIGREVVFQRIENAITILDGLSAGSDQR
jgi:glutamyl-tRNA synthetase